MASQQVWFLRSCCGCCLQPRSFPAFFPIAIAHAPQPQPYSSTHNQPLQPELNPFPLLFPLLTCSCDTDTSVYEPVDRNFDAIELSAECDISYVDILASEMQVRALPSDKDVRHHLTKMFVII
jgi:hypothetical protein